jgi:DNA-binding CsgD family transcriptional regulator
MAFLTSDSRELFQPLVEGIFETPPWGTLMHNLLARTQAQRGLLILHASDALEGQKPEILSFIAQHAPARSPINTARLARLRLVPLERLRAGRVYALDEMLDFSDPAQAQRQREALKDLGIPHGRWLRTSAAGADAWIILAKERDDFTAAAGAILSALSPLLAIALRARFGLARQQCQTDMAQAALVRLGIGQIALDGSARIIAADRQAEALLQIAEDPHIGTGRRLVLAPNVLHRVEEACAAFARGERSDAVVVPLGGSNELLMLLRPADPSIAATNLRPAAIGTIRAKSDPDPRSVASAIEKIHGLSEREAALATSMMRGEGIVEAGASLHLTPETSRNYSKRIYSKTGARGQADLVRLLLQGLAPLA